MHSRQRAGASSLAVIRAIWSRHQCVAGRLAGSSPVTIVAPSSKVKDGNIALHVWIIFPQKSGAASQRLLIVHVSGAAGLFLSAVELMPSTTQRSAPRPPKTRAATGAHTPNSGGIRAKFFNKIKGRKTSSLDRTTADQPRRRRPPSRRPPSPSRQGGAINVIVLRRPKQFDWRAKGRRTRRFIFSDVFSKY